MFEYVIHSEDIKFIIIIDGLLLKLLSPLFFRIHLLRINHTNNLGCIYRLTEVRKFLPA